MGIEFPHLFRSNQFGERMHERENLLGQVVACQMCSPGRYQREKTRKLDSRGSPSSSQPHCESPDEESTSLHAWCNSPLRAGRVELQSVGRCRQACRRRRRKSARCESLKRWRPALVTVTCCDMAQMRAVGTRRSAFPTPTRLTIPPPAL